MTDLFCNYIDLLIALLHLKQAYEDERLKVFYDN